jgi:hypothetical protein
MAIQTLTGSVADAGNLEKLPPEIRKQIYTHLLVEPKTIAIKRYIKPKAYKSGEVARMNHHGKADRNRKVYNRRRMTRVEAPPSTTSILLANKLINQEATPVFYGSNNFFFDNAGALQDFLLWIGQSRQHIRHVEIDGRYGRGIRFNISWTAMDRSLDLLESATGLRALHFYHNGFCGTDSYHHVGIGELVKHCTTLLRSLQATCKARNVKFDVLDVVKIVLPPCHCKVCPEPKARCRYFIYRDISTHALDRCRIIVTPGCGIYGGSCCSCDCLCEDADDKNKSFNERLKDGIARQLGLDTGREEA